MLHDVPHEVVKYAGPVAHVTAAPVWITYAALAMSVLALTVSLFDARTNAYFVRRAGAFVTINPTVSAQPDQAGRYACTVKAVNEGREAVSIGDLRFLIEGRTGSLLDFPMVGPAFPYKLEKQDSESWLFDWTDLALDVLGKGNSEIAYTVTKLKAGRGFRVTASLSNGQKVSGEDFCNRSMLFVYYHAFEMDLMDSAERLVRTQLAGYSIRTLTMVPLDKTIVVETEQSASAELRSSLKREVADLGHRLVFALDADTP